MGLELAEQNARSRALMEQAGRIASVDVFRLLSRGGPELARTEVLQPLMTAVSLGAYGALAELGIEPSLVAGHSLGEVAALAAARCVSAEQAVELAGHRGRLMAREAVHAPGGMLALLGGKEEMEQALALGHQHGVVDLAAHNAPEEWVLSGQRAALGAVAAAFPSRMLQVSGPWHCRTMVGAVEDMRAAVRGIGIAAPQTRLVCNRTGELVGPAEIPDLLAEQLTHPIQWVRTLGTLATQGVTDYLTMGPGRVMRGLLRKNLGEGVRVHAVERPADLLRIRACLAAHAAQTL